MINMLKKHPLFLCTFIATLIIWITGLNGPLFLLINAQYNLVPVFFWETLNSLSDPHAGILPLILLIVTCCFRREKLLNVVILILAYYVVFQLLKTGIHSPRPYAVYGLGDFFWIPQATPHFSKAVALRSFPSGHTGEAAIFVFASIHLWAEHKRWLRVLFTLFLVLVMLARICTGWHFPLDVLCGAMFGFLLTELCWYLPIPSKARLITKTKKPSV